MSADIRYEAGPRAYKTEVASESDVFTQYTVAYRPDGEAFSCTCPAFIYKGANADCKHIRRVTTDLVDYASREQAHVTRPKRDHVHTSTPDPTRKSAKEFTVSLNGGQAHDVDEQTFLWLIRSLGDDDQLQVNPAR